MRIGLAEVEIGFAVLLGVRMWMRYGPDSPIIPPWHQPQIPMENPLSKGIRYVAEKAFISVRDHPQVEEDCIIYGRPWTRHTVHACLLCNEYLEEHAMQAKDDTRLYHLILHTQSKVAYMFMMQAANVTGAVVELPYQAVVRAPKFFRKIADLVSQKIREMLPSPAINPETEKKIQEIQKQLNEKLVLNNLCQSITEEFKEVVDQFHLANDARAQVYTAISTETSKALFLSPQVLQAFLSSFQTLTKELGDLIGDQPETLKVYVELAVQLDEEKQCSREALAKLQKLRQELSVTTMEGIERKKNLEQKVNTLISLVIAATPDRVAKLPRTIQSGRYPFAPSLSSQFISTTNKA